MRKFLIGVIIILVGWDFFTTYLGTLGLFAPYRGVRGVFAIIENSTGFAHIGSLIFALALDTFIVCYKIILRADNNVTKPLLYIAFVYDFATSAFGCIVAMGGSGQNILQWAIVIFFALMTTAAPLLAVQILED